MKILITEDDVTSRNLFSALMVKGGHEVIAVKNAEEALATLKTEHPPKLIILDILIPGMNGLELCKTIRQDFKELNPYIIMLTVKGSKTDILNGFEAGADDYVTKPFDSGELIARINVGLKVNSMQEDLSNRIKEKELILAEVHHRMKNNMATIGSILDLHSDTIDDPLAVAALRDAKNRLSSMSMLYDKLYRSNNIRRMKIGDYLPSLVEQVVRQFPNANNIHTIFDLPKFSLGAKRLTNLGIIINELTTNSMKYAFGNQPGNIHVSAKKEYKMATIEFDDDGIGLTTINEELPGFGLKLVTMLSEQLNGGVELKTGKTGKGSLFIIKIEDDVADVDEE